MRSRMHLSSALLLMVGMVAMSSLLLPTITTKQVFAATTDKFGVDELYSTARNGPAWFLKDDDPEDDDDFKLTSADHIDIKKAASNIFKLDAETGSHKHGVRIHANSPDDDKEWKNVEITGYFKMLKGDDQFTLIARMGPTYNDDGGCGAYGYYGMLNMDGDAYFKKKLFHHGGYTDRTAVEENVVDDVKDRWIGLKMVVYNLNDDDVKLELWVDDGDEKNNWEKATEYVDDGNWETNHKDCDRSRDDVIDEGPRAAYRVDNSEFEFKDLSVREINP